MQFRKCTFQDGLKILPIAIKYETKELIDDCISILTPKMLNTNASLALNLSASCKPLLQPILNFFKKERFFNKFMNTDECFLLLEPKTMAILLNYVTIDSVILRNIFKWAEEYMKNHNEQSDLKSFLMKHGIGHRLTISCFESTKCFFDFFESPLGKNFFGDDVFKSFIKNGGFEHSDSKWFNVEAGQTITEKLILPNVVHVSNYYTKINFRENNVVFYEFPNDESVEMIRCVYSYNFDQCKDSEVFNESKQCTLKNILTIPVPSTELDINLKRNIVGDLKIKIIYGFKYGGRILKLTPKNFQPDIDSIDRLFFTSSVEVSYLKK